MVGKSLSDRSIRQSLHKHVQLALGPLGARYDHHVKDDVGATSPEKLRSTWGVYRMRPIAHVHDDIPEYL